MTKFQLATKRSALRKLRKEVEAELTMLYAEDIFLPIDIKNTDDMEAKKEFAEHVECVLKYAQENKITNARAACFRYDKKLRRELIKAAK